MSLKEHVTSIQQKLDNVAQSLSGTPPMVLEGQVSHFNEPSQVSEQQIISHKDAFARRRTEHPKFGTVLIPQRSREDDWYLKEHADTRFFPRKVPRGERVGVALGIPYRGITRLFMGNATRQAEKALRNPKKLDKLWKQSVDDVLTPPEPAHYKMGRALRYGVKNMVAFAGLIPGLEAVVWDFPSAAITFFKGRYREATLNGLLAATDFTPLLLTAAATVLTTPIGGGTVAAASILFGWLTEWRYFHPHVRKFYSDRGEKALTAIHQSFHNPQYERMRLRMSPQQLRTQFPEQERYSQRIAAYGVTYDGALKYDQIAKNFQELHPQVPQLRENFARQKTFVEDITRKFGGKKPPLLRFVQRSRFNRAYKDMLSTYELLEEDKRLGLMHDILFNAHATRNLFHPEQLASIHASQKRRR